MSILEGLAVTQCSPAAEPAPAVSADRFKAWMFDLPIACAIEGVRFLGQRLQAQANYHAAVLSCSSSSDITSANCRFAGEAASDYINEWGIMAQKASAALASPPQAMAA